MERRLREGFKVVRMLIEAYDAETARAWLFGTNSHLDERAPIQVLGQATQPSDLSSRREGRPPSHGLQAGTARLTVDSTRLR